VDAHYLRERGWPCPTAEQMRRIDGDAIAERGLSGRLLMENAGRAVAEAVKRLAPAARRPLVVCGGGNNGGDGFVIARVLREWDSRVEPTVLALGDPARRSEEARANFELLRSSGVEAVLAAEKELDPLLARCDLVIDALFGVGLSRAVEGPAAELLGALSRASLPVLAVDLPSGISSDLGEPLGPWLRPDWTVTLGLPKLGLAVRPQPGEVWVADIGLPALSLDAAGVHQHVWTAATAARHVPARPVLAHKGSFGHVLVVGGSEGKTGAAVLAAEGALRTGAGLVTVAAPRALNAVFEAKLTEAMTLVYEDAGRACLVQSALSELLDAAAQRDVLVIGPGVGAAPETRAAVAALLSASPGPAVVDADALNAFAGRPEALAAEGARVLTPHPGEMGRLLGRENSRVQADRVGAARELAQRADAVAVLKGARTVVAAPDGEVRVNPTGGPALASGGTGDVLAGAIAALLGQGLAPFDAATLGAWLHGRAGDRHGPLALAGDVARAIPLVLEELRAGAEEADGSGALRRFC
jgi:NAD(P)H-hydrate epimerase